MLGCSDARCQCGSPTCSCRQDTCYYRRHYGGSGVAVDSADSEHCRGAARVLDRACAQPPLCVHVCSRGQQQRGLDGGRQAAPASVRRPRQQQQRRRRRATQCLISWQQQQQQQWWCERRRQQRQQCAARHRVWVREPGDWGAVQAGSRWRAGHGQQPQRSAAPGACVARAVAAWLRRPWLRPRRRQRHTTLPPAACPGAPTHSQLARAGGMRHTFSLCFGRPEGGVMLLGACKARACVPRCLGAACTRGSPAQARVFARRHRHARLLARAQATSPRGQRCRCTSRRCCRRGTARTSQWRQLV
jgi:hypothetical protein